MGVLRQYHARNAAGCWPAVSGACPCIDATATIVQVAPVGTALSCVSGRGCSVQSQFAQIQVAINASNRSGAISDEGTARAGDCGHAWQPRLFQCAAPQRRTGPVLLAQRRQRHATRSFRSSGCLGQRWCGASDAECMLQPAQHFARRFAVFDRTRELPQCRCMCVGR